MKSDNYTSYMEELKAALTGLSIHVMPADMLGSWESLLEECMEGYSHTLYEFDDEMSVRNDIEKLLQVDKLKDYEQFQFFASAVEEIDAQIKEHLLLNVLPGDATNW